MSPYSIRLGKESDVAFIFATWLRGLYHGVGWAQDIDKDIFFKNYHRVIEAYLARPGIVVWVACLTDEPDVVLGYSVSEGPILHWLFVKKAWRKLGIGKALAPPGITTVSHLTTFGKSIKPPEWSFNPFV